MTRCLLVIAALSALPASLAFGQVDGSAPPAHLGAVDGAASIVRDGRLEEAIAGFPLVEGDAVRTDAGRVEIVMRDGSAVYLDAGSDLDIQSGSLIRLLAGRATLVVTGTSVGGFAFQLDTPPASLFLEGPGEYRVGVLSEPASGFMEAELAVVRGRGRVEWAGESVSVRAGETSTIRDGEAPTFPRPFNSARLTLFDRWVRDRQGEPLASRSGEYLPAEMQVYAGTFDQYGTWGQMPEYGHVWYPTAITAGWRPYHNGHWRNVDRYGWLWVGADPWGWPTHHFGHWGYHRGSWFWRPGRAWAPARVWWGVSAGHVAWCPTGIDGRPLFGFWGHGGAPGYDPWRGWTVVGRHAFGTRAHVGSVALDFRSFGRDPHTTFVFQRQAPAWRRGVPTNTWASRGRVGVVPGTRPGGRRVGASLGHGFVGTPGFGFARPAGGTRIESAPIGMMPIYPYQPTGETESPYRRAERVAAERRASGARARQAVPRSQAWPRTTPAPYPSRSPYPAPSPYPPQYHAAPAARAPQSRSVAPGGPGSWSARPGGTSRHGLAVPRPGPAAFQPPVAPARAPRAGIPMIQAPPATPPATTRTAVRRSQR
jgi:hypothetical protein